eukprot:1210441-Prymnesium_polylepis.1
MGTHGTGALWNRLARTVALLNDTAEPNEQRKDGHRKRQSLIGRRLPIRHKLNRQPRIEGVVGVCKARAVRAQLRQRRGSTPLRRATQAPQDADGEDHAPVLAKPSQAYKEKVVREAVRLLEHRV